MQLGVSTAVIEKSILDTLQAEFLDFQLLIQLLINQIKDQLLDMD